MTLHSNDLSALAKALAKAFPAYDARMRLAGMAEVASQAQIAGDALEAWRDIVHCAHQKKSLSVLVEAALREQPNNGAILRFREVSEPEEASGHQQSLGHLWVGMVLLIAGGVAYFVKGNEDRQPVEKVDVAVQAVAEEIATADEPIETENDPLPAAEVLEEVKVEAIPVVELVATQEAPATTEATGRCGGSLGSLVGYFYAGDRFSGVKGEPYTMTSDVNVRADYPHKANRWSSEAKIRCVLVRDDVLVLSESAIRVDGKKYWVPLYAGDLQKR